MTFDYHTEYCKAVQNNLVLYQTAKHIVDWKFFHFLAPVVSSRPYDELK